MGKYNFQGILFLDIETVSAYPTYDDAPEPWKELWNKKADALLRSREEETYESIYSRAGIYAEFGKIICISCGVLQGTGLDKQLIVKSFAGDNEVAILAAFVEMLKKWSVGENRFLCAHNGKEFDFPYLCRRLIINSIPVPAILDVAGKKPWEIAHLDTMELWKFGDYKSYTSLNLLAHALGIETPKDDIDGSQVGHVYWVEKNLERIVAYCQKDVVTVAQVLLRLQGETLIPKQKIEIRGL